jgi:hypothetical protein
MWPVDFTGVGPVCAEFETWYLAQDVKSQVELAAVSTSDTGKFEPFEITRSGPTLIGRSARDAVLSRRSTVAEPEPEPEIAITGRGRWSLRRKQKQPDAAAQKLPPKPKKKQRGVAETPEELRAREKYEEAEAEAALRWWWAGDGEPAFPVIHKPLPVRSTLYIYGDLTGRGAYIIVIRWA